MTWDAKSTIKSLLSCTLTYWAWIVPVWTPAGSTNTLSNSANSASYNMETRSPLPLDLCSVKMFQWLHMSTPSIPPQYIHHFSDLPTPITPQMSECIKSMYRGQFLLMPNDVGMERTRGDHSMHGTYILFTKNLGFKATWTYSSRPKSTPINFQVTSSHICNSTWLDLKSDLLVDF
jgi:hypothetical protein